MAVFPVAQEAQDWMNACVEGHATAKKKKHPAQGQGQGHGQSGDGGSSGGGGGGGGLSSNSTDDAEKELEKRIAADLQRKRQLLLRTPESDWMNEVPGDDEGSSSDEADLDSLDDEDNNGAEGSTTSSSERHAFVGRRKETSQPTISSRGPLGAAATAAAAAAAAAPVSPLRQSAPALTQSPASSKLRWKAGQLLSEGKCVRFFQAMNLDTGSTMAVRETTFPAPLPAAKKDAVERTLRYVQRLSSATIVPCKGHEWLPGAATTILVFLPDLRGGSLESLIRTFGPIPELSILRKLG